MSFELNLVGRYTIDEAELAGDSESLLLLADWLTTKQGFLCSLFRSRKLSSKPYDGFLAALEVSIGSGALVIDLRGSELRISGAPEYLALLAISIEQLANQSSKSVSQFTSLHTHIEYFPAHPYLAPSSISLVIVLEEKASSLSEC